MGSVGFIQQAEQRAQCAGLCHPGNQRSLRAVFYSAAVEAQGGFHTDQLEFLRHFLDCSHWRRGGFLQADFQSGAQQGTGVHRHSRHLYFPHRHGRSGGAFSEGKNHDGARSGNAALCGGSLAGDLRQVVLGRFFALAVGAGTFSGFPHEKPAELVGGAELHHRCDLGE